MRVLLADDQKHIRLALKLWLQQEAQIDVIGEASEVHSLLTRLKATAPDMILLDWELPGLSAIGSLRTLRITRPDLIVIALSARPETRREALLAGANAFVCKIDPPEQLLAALHAVGSTHKTITTKKENAKMAKITTQYKGNMLFESTLGTHKVLIDVPRDMGGSDRAPTPPEFFVASLGSCIGAFVANYCQQAGIDCRDLSVDVAFDKVGPPTRLVNLKITVTMPHAECKGREKALLRVAEHCPVHETIATLESIDFEFIDKSKIAGIPQVEVIA